MNALNKPDTDQHYSIVVTGVGAIIGQGIIKSLRQSNYNVHIIGIDKTAQSPASKWCDTFIQKPDYDESSQHYLEFWEQLLSKYEVDLIIPGIEIDVLFFNQHRNIVRNTKAKCVLNQPDLIQLALDKWEFGEYLDKNNIRRIPSLKISDWKTATRVLGIPPLLLKPRSGNGSRGIVKLYNKREFTFWTSVEPEKYVLQRIIGNDDEEYTVGQFGLGNGKALHSIIFRRHLSAAGNTQYAEVVSDPEIEKQVHQLTQLFKPLGPTNYQFRKENQQAYLLEINPRFSSSCSLRTAFGYNEADMSIDWYLRNQRPTTPNIRFGQAWRYSEDFVVHDSDSV